MFSLPEPPLGDGHHHLAAHHLALDVGVGIVLAGVVVPVLADGGVGHQAFQPFGLIVVQPALIVVDEHRGGDVHGIDQRQSFPDAARPQGFLHLGRDVEEAHPFGHFENQFPAITFHVGSPRPAPVLKRPPVNTESENSITP